MKSIAVCGVDGCGKSTIVNMLEDSNILKNVYFFRRTKYEDGNFNLIKKYFPRKYGDARDWKESEFGKNVGLGILLDFMRCYEENIKAMRNYDYVVFDRFLPCYLAYIDIFEDVTPYKDLFLKLVQPELTLYIDAGISNLEARFKARESEDDDEDIELMEMFDQSYRRVFEKFQTNYKIIDNSGALLSTKGQVINAIMSVTT